MCCDDDDGYGSCLVQSLENDLEQAREAIRHLRTIVLKAVTVRHDYCNRKDIAACSECKEVEDAVAWFDWNFHY